MTKSKFSEGSVAYLRIGRLGLQQIKIAKVRKTFVETTQGQRFSHSGEPYPHQKTSFLSLLPSTIEVTREFEVQQARQLLSQQLTDTEAIVLAQTLKELRKTKSPNVWSDS